ncbi:hypothetical protein [Kitasatospora sp. NBC_00315]|uniref:hypothetical protein n=1 Tax=Kitasatospora sp. NBC_00315 TaxID=2975963 RepID=UPI0032522C25
MHRLLDDAGPEGFLADWYGPPDRPAPVGPPAVVPEAGGAPDPVTEPSERGSPAEQRLPPALEQWYGVVAGYGRPVLFNHRIVAPQDLYEDGGLLAFCGDDFGAQEFGVEPGDGDPVVHQRWVGGGDDWEPHHEGLRLSQFLTALLVHESVQGARYGAGAAGLTAERCARLLTPLHRLPGPELFTRQYVGEGLLAVAWSEPDRSGWTVRLAAREEERLRYAAAVPGVTFGPGEWYPG